MYKPPVEIQQEAVLIIRSCRLNERVLSRIFLTATEMVSLLLQWLAAEMYLFHFSVFNLRLRVTPR